MTCTVLTISGSDAADFLQGLITNDVTRAAGGLIYAAILTPQGKYLADFFLTERDDAFLLDVDTALAPMLAQRLTMYRLRADVQIEKSTTVVSRGTGPAPTGALTDPRHSALGWRAYSDADISDTTDWDALTIEHLIPQSGVELTQDTYILEAGFERLNGVDFRKGCYVGQEVTARMKHKTELKKGLARVHVEGDAEPGPITTVDGKPVGTLYRILDSFGTAYLRFDRADAEMRVGDATVTRLS